MEGAAHETWTKGIGAGRDGWVAGRVAGGRDPGTSSGGTLTPRSCHTILSGDGVRRLDVCARGWVSDAALYTRGVVEMHTYAWNNGWFDSRSQSITMEWADNFRDGDRVATWGQSAVGGCRVNGPGGTVACSVANTVRVAFYGPQLLASNFNHWWTTAHVVSWRDDRGVAHRNHYIDIDPRRLGDQPLDSPVWGA